MSPIVKTSLKLVSLIAKIEGVFCTHYSIPLLNYIDRRGHNFSLMLGHYYHHHRRRRRRRRRRRHHRHNHHHRIIIFFPSFFCGGFAMNAASSEKVMVVLIQPTSQIS